MAKLSECLDYRERIHEAWSYCKAQKVLEDLALLITEWKQIDDNIRYVYAVRLERVPVAYYLENLKTEIQKSGNKKLTRTDLSADDMALSLYKFMEEHLPHKIQDGRGVTRI